MDGQWSVERVESLQKSIHRAVRNNSTGTLAPKLHSFLWDGNGLAGVKAQVSAQTHTHQHVERELNPCSFCHFTCPVSYSLMPAVSALEII